MSFYFSRFKNEVLNYALILTHWLLIISRFLKLIKCSVPAFLFVSASVLKPDRTPLERACRFGEIIVVVKVTNSEDHTMKGFIGSDLKSASHRCNQRALLST